MRRRDFIKVVTGSGMAACRARAAGRADAVDRRADGLAGELSGRAISRRDVPGRTCKATLD